jgi:hypothetical protein
MTTEKYPNVLRMSRETDGSLIPIRRVVEIYG